jgi:uncharacterized RDD family membrane protein YckC
MTTWVAGGPVPYAAPLVAADVRGVRYAGFWRRFWGLVVDGLIVNVVSWLAGVVIGFVGGLLLYATATCRRTDLGYAIYTECEGSRGLAIGLGVGSFVLSVVIWYRLVPRRLGAGATPGMHQMGLRAQGARDGLSIGPGAALGRSLLPFLLQVGGFAVVGVALVASLDEHDRVPGYWWWVACVGCIAVACYGPALWHLVDPRHQTLYDKLSGTVVVEERQPNWWGVASLACAMTVVLAPLAVVFGHVALHQLGRPRNRQAGHGLAVWGTTLGWLGVLTSVVFAVVVFAVGSPS